MRVEEYVGDQAIDADVPTFILVHGFPSSSFEFVVCRRRTVVVCKGLPLTVSVCSHAAGGGTLFHF